MDNRASKRRLKAESAAVRQLLLSWDPLGTGGAPADEYDCLVDHIVSAAHQGRASAEDIAGVISSELNYHFGAPVPDPSITEVAAKIAAEFRSASA